MVYIDLPVPDTFGTGIMNVEILIPHSIQSMNVSEVCKVSFGKRSLQLIIPFWVGRQFAEKESVKKMT